MSSLANWPQWLNSLSGKLGQEMKGLLRASYLAEFSYGRLENLDETGLYRELSRDKFTDNEARNLLIRRLFLLEEAGIQCIKSLAKYGLEVPTSAPHVGGLTQQSELVECFVHTIAKLNSVERKRVLDYLAKTELEVDPSNLSNMEIICDLFHKRKICVDDITPFFNALRSISAGRDVYNSLNDYCARYNLQPIQTCDYPTQVCSQYGAALVMPSGYIRTPNLGGRQPTAETQTAGLNLHWTAQAPQPISTLAGSSSHSETQKERRLKSVCCISFLVLISVLLIIGILVLSCHLTATVKAVRGIEGDVLYLDRAKSLWYTYWSARECLTAGDYTHTSSLYLVAEDDIIKYVKHLELRTPEIHAPEPSRTIGTISTTGIYLLRDSYIDYQLCLASTSSSDHYAEVFVFDNIENYFSFVDGVTTGDQNSVYHHTIPIGSSNNTECSTLGYTVTDPAHYFLTADTPVAISYTMNATLQIAHLNHSDYVEQCEVTQSVNCTIRIPSTLVGNVDYILLEYIHPLSSTDPLTTHTCVTQSSRLFHYAVVLGFLAIIAIIFLTCKIFHVINNRRKTYEHV